MSELPVEFIKTLTDLARWWEATGVFGFLIGGVAVSAIIEPRATKDVDATVLLDHLDLQTFLAEGKRFGFEPRIDDVLDFALANRILLLRHTPSGVPVDLALGVLELEYLMAERSNRAIPSLNIRVATPEDLVVLKCFAGRARDMIDVASILALRPALDLRYVREQLAALSEMMEESEISKRLERLISEGGRS